MVRQFGKDVFDIIEANPKRPSSFLGDLIRDYARGLTFEPMTDPTCTTDKAAGIGPTLEAGL